MPPDPNDYATGRDEALREVADLITRFGNTSDPALLTSVEADRNASALVAVANLEEDLQARHALGTFYWLRYAVAESAGDLQESVVLLGVFAGPAPEFVPAPMWPLLAEDAISAGLHANRLVRRFQGSGDPAVLVSALQLFRVAAGKATGPQRTVAWSNLCAALQLSAEHLSDPSLFHEAVIAGRNAVSAECGDEAAGNSARMHLSQAATELGLHTKDTDLLGEAVAVARALHTGSVAGSPERAAANGVLAAALQAEHTLTGRIENLHEAVDLTGEAVAITPETIGVHANHCSALNSLFDRDGSTATLRAVVLAGRAAANLLEPDQREARVVLGNLGMSLLSLYQQDRDLALLIEAEDCTERAVAAGDPASSSTFSLLANLSLICRTKYDATGERDVLDLAVRTGRAALRGMDRSNPHRPAAAANLTHALHTRFRRSGDADSLHEAARCAREAVELTPTNSPHRAGRLADLAGVLRGLFELERDPDVAVEAAQAAKKAVLTVDEDAPEFGAVLNTTSLLLRTIGVAAGDDEMIEEADALSTTAVGVTAAGSPDLPGRLSNKMIISRTRWERTKNPQHLRDAVDVGRKGINLLDSVHPHLPMIQSNLGLALSTLSKIDDDSGLREEALHCYGAAARSPRAVTLLRVWAGRAAAALAVKSRNVEAAVVYLEDAVELLPRLSGRFLRREDREHLLGRVNGFAAQIAHTFVLAGAPDRAVELLEQVRGLLQAETMQERGIDFANLRRSAPDLADRVDEVLRGFDDEPATDAFSEGELLAGPDTARRRELLDERWRALVAEVQSTPDLSDFLSPPSLSELRSAARGGPVIYAYAHNDGCGALVVREAEPVQVVELDEKLVSDEVFAQANALRAALADSTGKDYATRSSAERRISEILEWLWESFAGPIVNQLGTVERVWWCPIGVMSYFPLHAAGHHRLRDGRTVLDRVVSSYTPTLRALAHQSARAAVDPTVVLVSVPSPPVGSKLRGVEAEVETLNAILRNADVISGESAIAETVVAAMRRCAVAHLACHGVSDWSAPGSSCLVLADHDTDPLTLRVLAAQNFPQAELCYLSACSTSDAAPQLADQALHITSAVQLIGYRHVIGTLWAVDDGSARTIAVTFYSRLLSDSGSLDTTISASALQAAVVDVRDSMPGVPSHWAGHVHVGH